MELRKWTTNNDELRNSLENVLQFQNDIIGMARNSDASIKALGVTWNPTTDTLQFNPDKVVEDAKELNKRPTKRKLFSLALEPAWAPIFDSDKLSETDCSLCLAMGTQSVAEWTLEDCKAKQRGIRFKISGCYNRIQNIVTNTLSRRDAEKQLTDSRKLLGELETIHDLIIELVDDDDMARAQNTQHLTYASAVDGASAMVENYLLQRQDDTFSVVPETEEQIARKIALQATEQRVRDAGAKFEAAEQALIDLGGDISALEEGEVDPYDSVSQSGRKEPKEKVPSLTDVAEPPDIWIDTYLTGKEMPIVREKGAKSSVNVQLEAYTGLALHWFAWISMWFALVHITCKTPSEKLAILNNYLMRDLADIVHGHGGGEAGYMEVLQRLKSTCGSRKVIRPAYLWE
ncbi:hypothetical protein OUZ56_029466 [Daphnia magna]|uniref:Uncharacterized protein n=1 Tax=Daphnia magna TaxID=35525 RepID=A0ABR0B6W4_9CRUS|nr:hypothetical protein OUZ56_029466 [Daphnia magna]